MLVQVFYFLPALASPDGYHLDISSYRRIDLGNIYSDLLYYQQFSKYTVEDSFSNRFEELGPDGHFLLYNPV